MNVPLSFTDRDHLLEMIQDFGHRGNNTETLIKRVGTWAAEQKSHFGVKHTIFRNLTKLSDHLRHHENTEDISDIARGAINFVTDNQSTKLDASENSNEFRFQLFGRLGKAFVASFAAKEIANRLDEPIGYHPHEITDEERTLAENLFEEFSKVEGSDEKLIENVKNNLEEIHSFTECGFLRRLETSARALIEILTDRNRPAEEVAYARGALRYFVEDDDAIHDSLGPVGYLDDLFIVQIAHDLINPAREPLIELLDEVVGVWPFLNLLTFDTGQNNRPLSEFAIINAALSCRELRNAESINTLLITAETGSIPSLIGAISALGVVYNAGHREISRDTFRKGQNVFIDFDAVARFDGYEKSADGRDLFWLQTYYRSGSEKRERRAAWPISDIHRLTPAKADQPLQGEIQRSRRILEKQLRGLDFLFHQPHGADFNGIEKQIIVVTPLIHAKEFCNSTKLYEQPITEAMPVGQVSAGGQSAFCWSSKFKHIQPILCFASDLDIATAYATDNSTKIDFIIVDAAGPNKDKHASLRRIISHNIPLLIIASERVANDTDLDEHQDLNVWEWRREDMRSLIWPRNNRCVIGRLENRIRNSYTIEPGIEIVSLPEAHNAFIAYRALRWQLNKRGSDKPIELEDIIAQSFYALTHLLRYAVPVTSGSQGIGLIKTNLHRVAEILTESHFISEDEQILIREYCDAADSFLSQLVNNNPKAKALAKLTTAHPDATIFCPDWRLFADFEAAYTGSRNKIIAAIDEDAVASGFVIIPGWFREAKMASALQPPVADPIKIILYDTEYESYETFTHKRKRARQKRAEAGTRANIFPRLRGWKPTSIQNDSSEDYQETAADINSMQNDLDARFKERIHTLHKAKEHEADAKARMVIFSGNAYGLFTDSYKLNIVTHLLDRPMAEEDDSAKVNLMSAKDVRIGDAVVFRPKDRNLIREVADEILPAGCREIASLWQHALRRFVAKHSLSVGEMCERLKGHGASYSEAAIRNWVHDLQMIAPQSYKRDIAAIAEAIKDNELREKINEVCDAIRKVRVAHQQKAPRKIAKQIQNLASNAISQEQRGQEIVYLEDDLILVRVIDTDKKLLPVKYSESNRLVIEG